MWLRSTKLPTKYRNKRRGKNLESSQTCFLSKIEKDIPSQLSAPKLPLVKVKEIGNCDRKVNKNNRS